MKRAAILTVVLLLFGSIGSAREIMQPNKGFVIVGDVAAVYSSFGEPKTTSIIVTYIAKGGTQIRTGDITIATKTSTLHAFVIHKKDIEELRKMLGNLLGIMALAQDGKEREIELGSVKGFCLDDVLSRQRKLTVSFLTKAGLAAIVLEFPCGGNGYVMLLEKDARDLYNLLSKETLSKAQKVWEATQ